MVKEVKFLLNLEKKDSSFSLTYFPYYFCFSEERSDPTVPYSPEKAIGTNESGFDEIVDLIVRDWCILQIAKNPEYILGLTCCFFVPVVFSSKEQLNSFTATINRVIKQKFSKEFLSDFDNGTHKILFDLIIEIGEGSCKLVSSKIKKYETKKTVEDDLDFIVGVNEKEIPTKISTIKFIVKTVPTTDDFEPFYLLYNRLYDSFSQNEVYDTPSYFLSFKNDYNCDCCGWAVEDWFQLQLIERESYILGFGLDESLTSVVHQQDIFDEIMDKTQRVVYAQISKDFIKTFDGNPHAFLFEVKVQYNFAEVSVLSSKVKDILNSEEPNFKNIPVPRKELLKCTLRDFN